MKLYSNWKTICKQAWSLRFNAIAIFFACAEFLLPYYADSFQRGVFTVFSVIAIAGSMISRIVYQQDL